MRTSPSRMIRELANRPAIDPDEAADVLGLRVVHVEQVTMYRREYQLGGSPLWLDATAVVGGPYERWRVLDLVPRELSLAALDLDPADEVRPHVKHTNDGVVVTAHDHHYRVPAGTLVVCTPADSLRIARITFISELPSQ